MDVIQDVGAYAGFAAVVGLAVLAALYFSQARDVRRLREWAGRAPERAAEQAAQVAATPEQAAQEATKPAPSGAVRPIPAAKPAAGAKPDTEAKPAPATPPGKAPTPVGKPAAAAAAGAAPATASGPAPATAAGAPAKEKPDEAEKKPEPAKPGDGAPAKPGDGAPPSVPAKPPVVPAPATAAAGPAPATAAGGPAPATPPPRPSPPPVLPARPAPPVRSPAAANTSQSTAVLPASTARLRDRSRRGGGVGQGLSPRYIALIVAGVIVIGGGAAFGISQLGGDDEASAPGSGAESPPEPVNPSFVTVSVLNGTTVPGLAAQIGDEVEAAGFQRGNVANALDQQRTTSTVLFAAGKEREARAVARKLDIATVEPIDPDSQALGGSASVVVIVGADQTQ